MNPTHAISGHLERLAATPSGGDSPSAPPSAVGTTSYPLSISVCAGKTERARSRLEHLHALERYPGLLSSARLCWTAEPGSTVLALGEDAIAGREHHWRFEDLDVVETEDGELRAGTPGGLGGTAGLALVERRAGADRLLAYQRIERTPGESESATHRRLDAFVPQLVADAALRLAAGHDGLPLPPPSQVDAPAHRKRVRAKLWIGGLLRHFTGVAPGLFRQGHETRVVLLHRPAPDVLDGILTLLARLGPFVSFSDVADALTDGRSPPPGFVVTFDDGAKENALLLDTLARHRCRAMFYVSTASFGTRRPLWFMNKDRSYLAHKATLKGLGYRPFQRLAESLGLTSTSGLHWRFGLTEGELRELRRSGHDIGVHTVTHPFLTRCTGPEIEEEILCAHARLCEVLGEDDLPLDVAYPDGDHDARVVAELRRIGARTAVTIERGSLSDGADPLRLPRFGLGDLDAPGYAAFKLTAPYRWLRS